jgi:F-type H+-transporting ATPase subunit b
VLIDWFTIVAQIVNFLVLVFLLHRFLYGPIVKMMDDREERIFARLKEAERREESAEAEAQHYRQERAQLDEHRRRLLIEAEEEAESRRKELLHRARQEAEATQRQWRKAIEHEKEHFLHELRRRTTHHVYAVARRAIFDLAEVDLERQMVKVFLRRLRTMSEAERRALRSSSEDGRPMLVVYSAFELSQADGRDILDTLQEITENTLEVEFKTSASVINGIELRSASHRVAWNLAHYLTSLEEDLSRMIEQETHESATQSEVAGTVAAGPLPGGG